MTIRKEAVARVFARAFLFSPYENMLYCIKKCLLATILDNIHYGYQELWNAEKSREN